VLMSRGIVGAFEIMEARHSLPVHDGRHCQHSGADGARAG
jgi:hypothetical protein